MPRFFHADADHHSGLPMPFADEWACIESGAKHPAPAPDAGAGRDDRVYGQNVLIQKEQMMDTLRTSVATCHDGDEHIIVVTLKGVPIIVRVHRPERYNIALHEIQTLASQVAAGMMHWSEASRRLARRSEYYSAPVPPVHAVSAHGHDWSLEHVKEIGVHVGQSVLHAPAAIAHFAHEHLPHRHH